MITFDEDVCVVKVADDQGIFLGSIIQQDGCGGWLFQAERPVSYQDLKTILCEMEQLIKEPKV